MNERDGILKAIATRPAKRAPMVTRQDAIIDPRTALAGDFGRKPGKRQVSVLSWEKWLAACATLGVTPAEVPWTFRRANLLVAGIDLPVVPGRRLAVGSVVLEITGEADPCQRMEQQFAGLQAALTPDARGGLVATIITGAAVAVGDKVKWL